MNFELSWLFQSQLFGSSDERDETSFDSFGNVNCIGSWLFKDIQWYRRNSIKKGKGSSSLSRPWLMKFPWALLACHPSMRLSFPDSLTLPKAFPETLTGNSYPLLLSLPKGVSTFLLDSVYDLIDTKSEDSSLAGSSQMLTSRLDSPMRFTFPTPTEFLSLLLTLLSTRVVSSFGPSVWFYCNWNNGNRCWVHFLYYRLVTFAGMSPVMALILDLTSCAASLILVFECEFNDNEGNAFLGIWGNMLYTWTGLMASSIFLVTSRSMVSGGAPS